MSSSQPHLPSALVHGLSLTLDRTDLDELGPKYEGKVRDNYLRPDGTRVLVTTDRISAFDRVLGTLPFKGQVLNTLAAFWFEKTKHVAPNHVIAVPDPNVTIAHECTPLPAEFVVRAYLTGVTSTSIWTHYSNGARVFAGHAIPDGLVKNDALPKPILTPSTKAAHGGHDVTVSKDELLATSGITPEDFEAAEGIALSLFRFGQELARSRGFILVDTKYELGKTKDGRIVVIDEMHTPDSSRYWFAGTYEERRRDGHEPDSFDKEYVRRWLASTGYRGEGTPPVLPDEIRVEAARRYIEACEMIMGAPFEPNVEEPMARIRKNLAAFGR